MRYRVRPSVRRPAKGAQPEQRIRWIAVTFALGGFLIVGRLFQLQVLEAKTYRVLASDQHEVQASLVPRRGTIYLKDRYTNELHPIAKDRDAWQVYAVTREMKDREATAKEIANLLAISEGETVAKLTSPTTTYAVLSRDVSLDLAQVIRTKRLPGIGVIKTQARMYPEEGLGGQFIGFVGMDEGSRRVGRYGVEGSFNDELSGSYGTLVAERDAAGRRLTIADLQLEAAHDGSDLVLTIDRTIQYEACAAIKKGVLDVQAVAGTIIVMDPQTGAVWAMCSYPDFEPATYNKIDDISVLNNPATFYQYEPGSVFKPITIAAGLDTQKISPQTTYTDIGQEKLDEFTVRNSDKQAHGVQTMTQVLEKSLNLGTIFVQRLLGKEIFRQYVKNFGFGKKTGIGLDPEAKGDITPLEKKGPVFAATASYGQGISVTPIQLAASFAALGNGGKLFQPYIVQARIKSDGQREEIKPQLVRQVIQTRTSRLVSAMMVNVVENGHGKRAAVPGYYVAGKTGTAQIPNPTGVGYLEGVTIGTFAGYAPADNPKFVMLVKIDRPKTVQYAEASAAPVFGAMAAKLVKYLQIPPERLIVEKPAPPPAPVAAASSSQPVATSTKPD
jgi:cell division protein FtsI/penicillin-binding protein 2